MLMNLRTIISLQEILTHNENYLKNDACVCLVFVHYVNNSGILNKHK